MTQKNVDKPNQANSIDSIESANDSKPQEGQKENLIANMDAIDFQTLLSEQMNRWKSLFLLLEIRQESDKVLDAMNGFDYSDS